MDSQSDEAFFHPSWSFYSTINSSFDYGFMDMDVHVDAACEFSSSFSTPEDTNSDSSSIPGLSTLFPNEFAQSPACCDDHLQALSVEDFLLLDHECFQPNFNGDIEFLYGQSCESEESFPSSNEVKEGWSPSPSIKSNEVVAASTPIQTSSLILPGQESEVESRLSVLHLLKAYGEATENHQNELADVIMRCVSEKVSLAAGEPLLRLAFNLSQHLEKQGYYLKQESSKNFEAAFRAFYQIFPYGRFAHFAANSAILEAMPADAKTIHIVDFDMGEGVQWPPMLEALAGLQKGIRLTTIKWEEEDGEHAPLMWSFEEVKRRLVDHARIFGLKLKVEEVGIEDLVSEIKRTKKRGGGKEWLAFNCMTGLPHMGRLRSRKVVEEFVRVAEDLMANSANCSTSNRGIITFGEGDAWENLKMCSGFASFFEGNLVHYQALLESIEMNLPSHLDSARMALESLFATPFISSEAWFQRWTEMKECQTGTSLEGLRMSSESLEEAKEMVKGKQSLYEVRVGGEWNNEMILEWRGTPLVRVTAWRK